MKHLSRLLLLSISFMVVFTACEDDYVETNQDNNLPGIMETLENFDEEITYDSYEFTDEADPSDRRRRFKKRRERVTFFTLTRALVKTRLLDDVLRGELTVFAPSDEAFAKIGLNFFNVASVPNLEEILLYHVVPGRVFSTDLSNGFVPTANGAAVEVNLEGGVFINNAQVIRPDLRTRRGVIHIVNEVLLPPTQDLAGIATGNENFSILVEAVSRVGLLGALTGDDQLTVFAPTNDAFVALLGELGATSLDDIDDATLTAVLLYHIVPGRVYSSDLSDELEVATLNGGTFTVDLDILGIRDANGRESGLVVDLLNLQATNGVVHVIDRVILP